MQYIFWYDWILSLFLILIVLIWAKLYVKKNSNDALLVRYFNTGLLLKIIGCIAYIIYHRYVYNGGDTFSYFDTARQFNGYLSTDFDRYLKLVFYPVDKSMDVRDNDVWLDYIMVYSESNAFQARLSSIIQLFTFGTFVPTSLIFSLLSYVGIWKCFKAFVRLYPDSAKSLAVAFLFIPSVIFWGSGISKESVSIGSICALSASVFYCFIFKEKILRNLFSIIFFTAVLLIVKTYIAISFLPPVFLGLVFLKIQKIKTPVFRMIAYPLSFLLIIGVVIFIFDYTSKNFSKYAVETLAEKIVHSNTTMKKDAGSAYDLGIKPEDINNMGDLVPYFPEGMLATLYRPWIWEIKNPAMLLSALEGLVFLILTLLVFIKGKIYKPFKIIIANPMLFACFIYVIMFAGLVGLSTGNFGTLVRYKLPIMPFFGLTLLILLDKMKKVRPKTDSPGNNFQGILSNKPSSLS